MKTYTYEQPFFTIEVLITGIFCAFIAVVCLVFAALQMYLPPALSVMFAVVALYQVWNTFIAIANPEKVTFEDDAISFSAFGRTDRFAYSDISEFRVREFPSAGKMYIRINDGGLLKGRYWIQSKVMSDGEELFNRILDFEYAKHPDTIKARARRVNTEYLEHQEQIEEHLAADKRAARENLKKKITPKGRKSNRSRSVQKESKSSRVRTQSKTQKEETK